MPQATEYRALWVVGNTLVSAGREVVALSARMDGGTEPGAVVGRCGCWSCVFVPVLVVLTPACVCCEGGVALGESLAPLVYLGRAGGEGLALLSGAEYLCIHRTCLSVS